MTEGAFVAVVGPSGAGKDALIRYAAERLGGAVHVPRRVITRPAGAGEDHEPATEEQFAAAEARGAYAAAWRAHGLRYGIPAAVDHVVNSGGIVLANVSRSALAALAARYPGLLVVRVTADEQVRAERLARRKRESDGEIAARLARPDPDPGYPVDLEVCNDGELAIAGNALVEFLRTV